MKFIDVSTGYPGSIHDARILRLSSLFQRPTVSQLYRRPVRNINGLDIAPLIVGDSAYPLKEWLMKPYPDNGLLSNAQKRFNKKLSQGRVIAEQAYGHLKGRWRCLDKRLDDQTEMFQKPSLHAAYSTTYVLIWLISWMIMKLLMTMG